MRRVALAVVSTVTGLVMLLSFKTHAATTSAAAGPTATAGPGTPSGAGGSAATPSPSSGTSAGNSAGSPASNGTKTVTGDAADTRYGPVQVQITVSNGKLTGVTAVDYPQNDPRDQEINAYAIPQLNSEALAAKSAKIDMVSGATYTSDGYIQSLQSALDQAGL
jgi:uncharacterized protein with FMN-binding domain